MTRRRPTILYVDDDEVSVMAFERAVAAHQLSARIEIARDGSDAMTLLKTPGAMALPCVIVLDLNMPGLNGLDVLKQLRADPALSNSVVFVLTTSDAPEDIRNAYAHNISGYFLKKGAYGSIGEVVALIGQYIRLATLPG